MTIEEVREFAAALNTFKNGVWLDVDQGATEATKGIIFVTATPMAGRTLEEAGAREFTHVDPIWILAWLIRQLIVDSTR